MNVMKTVAGLFLFLSILQISSSSKVSVPLAVAHKRKTMPKNKRKLLGDVFTNKRAAKAFKKNLINSKSLDDSCRIRVVFINELKYPLKLCWVGESGSLHHYYTLEPCSPIISGLNKDGIQIQKKNSHLENTFTGHAFLLAHCPDGSDTEARIGKIIGGYRPMETTLKEEEEDHCIHIITVKERDSKRGFGIRKGRKIQLCVEEFTFDSTPLDTSDKLYDDLLIAGWKCKVEKGLFDNLDKESKIAKVKRQLELDLENCSKKLPAKACKMLMEKVPIFINKSQKYGPKVAPVVGKGMCYHNDTDYLKRNGMSLEKVKCVELFEAGKYLDDHDLWYGEGGVMIHEMSHAYHDLFCKDGFENENVKNCYDSAMKENLYDLVQVHSMNGAKEEAKAYACTNQMEYFAELSTAFLGGVSEDKELEFNKWYPFNRSQIKEHDPRAFKMLCEIWEVGEAEE